MICPIDNTELKMTERQGVEIDYCPKCRGVWLDRGELDKILERSATIEAGRPRDQHDDDDDDDWDDRRERRYDDDRYREYPQGQGQGQVPGQPRKKRRSFLSDLFDFE